MTVLSRLCVLLTLSLVSVLTLAVPPSASDFNPALQTDPVIVPKAATVLSAKAEEFLLQRDEDTASVWVFFTDKGVKTKAAFNRAAQEVVMQDRAWKRRKKVALDHVVFADLPVESDYIGAIVALGGEHRYNSRWLNAASFNLPIETLEVVAQLPFVLKVQPVCHGVRKLDNESRIPVTTDISQQGSTNAAEDGVEALPYELRYGKSDWQLLNNKVPSAHAQGLSGKGVLLSHFDTGYQTSHAAYNRHFLEGRVLGMWDFVQNDSIVDNEAGDNPDQQEHGTATLSTSSGYWRDMVIGPAYRNQVLLAKTEWFYVEVETEEDFWVAALEWSDSAGADVVSSSLSYDQWYNYSQLDGYTAVTTRAVNLAADMGIVVCNAMGNDGPAYRTINAPADAHDMLACGATDSMGVIAPFSGRGPSADGRIKPDVVAQGMYVYCASTISIGGYQFWGGTSFSTPLVAGSVCLMVEAHPDWHPRLIVQAIKETADNALNPDSTYGWGMLNVDSALKWGPHLVASSRFSDTPMTVQFIGESVQPASNWRWDFGDGDSAFVQDPSHTYVSRGLYDVTVTAITPYGDLREIRKEFIAVVDDSITIPSRGAGPGTRFTAEVIATNTVPVYRIEIPFVCQGDLGPMVPDSVSVTGCRTEAFVIKDFVSLDPLNGRGTVILKNNLFGLAPYLEPGTGPILRLYYTMPPEAIIGQEQTVVVQPYGSYLPRFSSEFGVYAARTAAGVMAVTDECCDSPRGDVNLDRALAPDIADLTYLTAFMFRNGPEPACMKEADIDGSGGGLDISDLTYLIGFMFRGGPEPVDCD